MVVVVVVALLLLVEVLVLVVLMEADDEEDMEVACLEDDDTEPDDGLLLSPFAVAATAPVALLGAAAPLATPSGVVYPSCACSRKRASSTASFLVVSPLSRSDVRLTDCALVLLLCDRRTRLRCASANRLLSCSVFSCSIRSRISGSSQISEGVSSFLFLAFKSAPLCASISNTSMCPQQAAACTGVQRSLSTASVDV
uniref:Secreted protein n=1 Tax=Anopheles darlingi TaxID=43151 RepID=A0A2M4DJ17_ANODA